MGKAAPDTCPRGSPGPSPTPMPGGSPGESTTPCRRALLGCWGSGACAGLGASVGNVVLAMSGGRGDALGTERGWESSSWTHQDIPPGPPRCVGTKRQ